VVGVVVGVGVGVVVVVAVAVVVAVGVGVGMTNRKPKIAEVVRVNEEVHGGIIWQPNDSCLPERHRPYISADLPLAKFIERWAEINRMELSDHEKKWVGLFLATFLNQ